MAPHLSPPVHTHASLPQHILNCFVSRLSFPPVLPFPPVCLCVCFALLCCSFPHSSPCFDMAGSWNFQPHNPRHQKFIEPGKQTCEAARRGGDAPTLPSLPLFRSLVFCLLSSSPRSISLFMLPALPPSPHLSLTSHFISFYVFSFFLLFHSLSSLYHPPLSLWQFSPIVAGMQLLSPLALSSSLSLSLLLLSLFDTVNKQVEVAVIVDASAEVPGNE